MKMRKMRVTCSVKYNLPETMERDNTFFNAAKEIPLPKLPTDYHNYKKLTKIC